MKETVEYAYAKVNVTLEVLGKREDGYHELRSIFLPLEFHDFIQVRITPGTQKIQLISEHARLNTPRNLMYKAAELVLKTYQIAQDVEIEYRKAIPSQAGLGGGSADAAAVIRALLRLCEITVSETVVIEMCKAIGADVPFCYFNKPALVSGIGEKLEFFSNACDAHVILIKPKKGASTKKIFQTMSKYTDGENASHYMKQGLQENDLMKITKWLRNDLEAPAIQIVPEIGKIKAELEKEGIKTAIMSGSGSTVLCLVDNDHLAKRIVKQYNNRGFFAVQTKFLQEKQ